MKFKMTMHSRIARFQKKKKNIRQNSPLSYSDYLEKSLWYTLYRIKYIEIFTTRKFTFPLNASGILRELIKRQTR